MAPRQATTVDLAQAAAALADAYIYDPWYTWLWRDPTTFAANATEWFSMVLRNTFRSGHTHVDEQGAVTWIPPDVEVFDTEGMAEAKAVISAQVGDRTESVLEYMGRMGAVFHDRPARFHLVAVGVRTAAQQRGLGTSLLRRTLDVCDRDGLPASMTSTNDRHLDWFRSLGFTEIDGAMAVAGSACTLRPMWREPQT